MHSPVNPSLTVLAPLAQCEAIARGPEGDLWAAGANGTLYRIDSRTGSVRTVGAFSGLTLGLCLDAGGRVYGCVPDAGAVEVFDPHTGRTAVYCDTADDKPLTMPNWPVFAPDGTMFVSDSGVEALDTRDGQVITIPAGGGDGHILVEGPLAFANGLALHPDGSLFVAESFAARILRITPDGTVAVHADLDGHIPDGLALDADGGLIVACYQPNRILRLHPDSGEPAVLADDWTGIELLTPTNTAFFGDGLSRLAIASLCGSVISEIDPGIAGMPLNYPEVAVAESGIEPMPIAGVAHLGITVSDLAVARRFYIDGLGCQEVAAQHSSAPYLSMTGYDPVELDLLFVGVPGSELVLELTQYLGPVKDPARSPGTRPVGSTHLCLVVSDLAASLARLESFGAERVTDPMDIDRGINAGSRGVYLRDPDGYTIELFERRTSVSVEG